MRIAHLFAVSLMFGSALVACGDDGGSNPVVDAPIVVDAPPDAPAGLTGLGQSCNPAMMDADCPANAPSCVGLAGGTKTYCTPLCLTNGSATTDATGQIMTTTPAPTPATCTGAYSGAIGTAVCGVILTYTPMDAMLMPNKAYTGINLGCAIRCSAAGTCPTGFAASGAAGAGCVCR